MKYIIAFLLPVALLCFSIVTGRAEQPTELSSGTYNLSLTSKDGKDDEERNLSVRLTTKIKSQHSLSSGDKTTILTDIVMELDEFHAKFVGHSIEDYDEGKLINGYVVLSWTELMPKEGHTIKTFDLIGTVSNHSARGEGGRYEIEFIAKERAGAGVDSYRFETAQFKWTLTKQP